MWQRVQTLYLAISSILIGTLFFCNICKAVSPQGEVAIGLYEKIPYLVFNIMVFTATVITLFTYKLRLLQMRVAILSALLLFGFQIWIGVDFVRYQLIQDSMIYLVPSIFPLVAGILNVIAARNIMLDEAMVQSVAIRQELSKRRRKAKK
jgi:hypothetical protein